MAAILCFLIVSHKNCDEYLTLKNLSEKVADPHPRKCRLPRTVSTNCRLLFQGKKKVKPLASSANEAKECKLTELVKDCSRLGFEHGYYDKPISKEELAFPIAFGIKMHTEPQQVERMLRTIYRPHNFYCIHVDSKATDKTYKVIKSVADCLKNVVVLPNRVNAIYSSIRLVIVEFDCMKCAIASGVKWKYYINLTGQEFVLRTNRELVEILNIFNGTNDVESYPLTFKWRVKMKYVILQKSNRMKTQGRHSPFKYNLTLYKGSAYGMFTRDFVDFLLTDDIALDLYHWLNQTYAPEETIWATLNRLPFAPGGYPAFDIKHNDRTHASKAVLWTHEKDRCHGKFVHSVCVFNSGDLPWLRSRPEIAANKFYESFDSVVLDCLEEWVNHRAYSESLEELNWYYYMHLPHVNYNRKLKDLKKSKDYLHHKKTIWLRNILRRKAKVAE